MYSICHGFIPVRVFNVGKYRRVAASGACAANFFDANNKEASNLRQKAASMALEDMLSWLDDFSDDSNNRKDRIGIFDATNSTKERREWVLKECTCNIKRAGKPTGVVFVESICDDKELLHTNLMTKVNNSPDYKGMDPEEAMKDILDRVRKYEEQYETIEDDSLSYIKIFNLSSKILVNHIYGRMAKSIVPALMAWNIGTR
jgi:6-phosphofructo-2-kinase/fructose-2,6-biphosphatase 2